MDVVGKSLTSIPAKRNGVARIKYGFRKLNYAAYADLNDRRTLNDELEHCLRK